MIKCHGPQKAQAGRGPLHLMMQKVLISWEEQFQERASIVYLGALEELALTWGEGGQELGKLTQ